MSSIVISATTAGACECCGPSCSFNCRSVGGGNTLSILSSLTSASQANILLSFGSLAGFTMSATLTINQASWSLTISGTVPSTIGASTVGTVSIGVTIQLADGSSITPTGASFAPGGYSNTWSGTLSRSQSWFQGGAQEFLFDAAPSDSLFLSIQAKTPIGGIIGTGTSGTSGNVSFSGTSIGTSCTTWMIFPTIPSAGQFDGSVNFQVCRATGTLTGMTPGRYYAWLLPSQYRAHGSGGPWTPDTTNLYEIGIGLVPSEPSEVVTIDMLCGSNPGASCPGPTYGAGVVDVEPIGTCVLQAFP